MEYKVCKFGGSSVANAEQIKKVIDIVLTDTTRKYIVVSAPGKSNDEKTKVTDLLIKLADDYNNKKGWDLSPLLNRYGLILDELEMPDRLPVIAAALNERLRREYDTDAHRMDAMKAMGEELTARIIAQYLFQKRIPSEYADPADLGIEVTPEFGNAAIIESSYSRIKKHLEGIEGKVIIPGFFGYTSTGDIATFSRGGSDLTGAVVAAAVEAFEYENWTDVDGIFMADPRVVDKPKQIKHITYDEIRELSYMGFSVFHDEAMFPVIKHHVPTHLRNTNKPYLEGTRILEYRLPPDDEVIVGVACKKGFATIDIKKYMMNREVGFIRRTAELFEKEKVSIEHIPSGIDSISVIVEKDQLENGKLNRLVRRFHEELNADSVGVRDDHALVCAVGQGMIHKVGVAQRVTGACARNGINIEMINQGASELSITLTVKEKDADDTVRAVYSEFVK